MNLRFLVDLLAMKTFYVKLVVCTTGIDCYLDLGMGIANTFCRQDHVVHVVVGDWTVFDADGIDILLNRRDGVFERLISALSNLDDHIAILTVDAFLKGSVCLVVSREHQYTRIVNLHRVS